MKPFLAWRFFPQEEEDDDSEPEEMLVLSFVDVGGRTHAVAASFDGMIHTAPIEELRVSSLSDDMPEDFFNYDLAKTL